MALRQLTTHRFVHGPSSLRRPACAPAKRPSARRVLMSASSTPIEQWLGEEMSKPAYRYGVQGVVLVAVLGLIDAGFSGDWSRTGALTVDQEAYIRSITPIAVGAHLAMAPVSYYFAVQKGWDQRDALVVALKTSLVGTVALLEAYLAKPPSQTS